MSNYPSLGDLAKKEEKVDPNDRSAGAVFQKKMQDLGQKELEVDTMRKAASLGHAHIDLRHFPVSQQALRQIEQTESQMLKAVCFYFTQDEFRLGAVDPDDPRIKDLLFSIEERNHAKGAVYMISERSFAYVYKLYDTLPVIKAITKDVTIQGDDLLKVQADITDFRSLQALLTKATTTDTVTYLLAAALKLDSSDMHVEAEAERVVVRFRLDGILHDAAVLPKDTFRQLVSRVKLISALKINITDKPQDGRFTVKLPNGEVDMRVSTMPTVYGESIVMRILKQSREGLTLDQVGLYGDAYVRLKREIDRPNGMIITTGPTGSGKTTTLYACMQLLNEPGVKIITLEDPVEYRMAGVNQSQIDRSKDYTFAKGLRSILRQDPDIAMVGEIRDLETADIAIQAALTGHLMLSTIHTNSAAGAIPRFLSMGVKPFLLAPSLNCVIGQRLVRRLCTECKMVATFTPELEERFAESLASMPEKEKALFSPRPTFYTAKGCTVCNGIGYKGRTGIYEILTMNQEIEGLILSGQVSEYEIEANAVKHGMVTMVHDGLLKAREGVTSVDEIFRVIE
jgi:type II secretory ATPase GspE/PulE/Tfp pilus assembly ATPase PilB-like protein